MYDVLLRSNNLFLHMGFYHLNRGDFKPDERLCKVRTNFSQLGFAFKTNNCKHVNERLKKKNPLLNNNLNISFKFP